jgi:hypothetical protein
MSIFAGESRSATLIESKPRAWPLARGGIAATRAAARLRQIKRRAATSQPRAGDLHVGTAPPSWRAIAACYAARRWRCLVRGASDSFWPAAHSTGALALNLPFNQGLDSSMRTLLPALIVAAYAATAAAPALAQTPSAKPAASAPAAAKPAASAAAAKPAASAPKKEKKGGC